MPTHSQVQIEVETRLQDNWSDPDVDLRFENEARKIPPGPFVRLTIRSGRSQEKGYAGNKILYRRPGIIWAQCFVPRQFGTQKARSIADAVLDIFEGQQFGGITCSEGEVQELGDDGKGFWQANAKIYFDHDIERSY